MRETASEESGFGRLWLNLGACAAVAVALLAAAPILLPAATTPVEPAEDAGRGTAVAVDGGWLAVGARFADRFEPSTGNVGIKLVPGPQGGRAERVGAVYLYQKSGGNWLERRKLIAADARPGDQFGSAVALRGDTLAVGAPGWSRGAEPRQGAVYLYRQMDGAWVQQEIVTGCKDSPPIDRFGRSLALDGGWLAVGGAGAVCIRTSEPQIELRSRRESRLQPAVGAGPDSRFGESVAISGPLLAVGAPGRDVGACRSCGGVDLFQLGTSGWASRGSLPMPQGASFDQFGSAVAVSGSRIAVGAVGATTGGRRSGAVYVFVASGSGWTALPPLTPPGRAQENRFGAAVALDGDLLAVGAPSLPLLGNREASLSLSPGSVHVFDLGPPDVPPPPPLLFRLSTFSGKLDLFGAAVALRDGEVVVGAPLAGTGGKNAGSAWAYHCAATSCTPEGELAPLTVLPDPGKGRPQ